MEDLFIAEGAEIFCWWAGVNTIPPLRSCPYIGGRLFVSYCRGQEGMAASISSIMRLVSSKAAIMLW
jgi:hypothetical protein